ncbi:MAG: hypothetical protein Q7T59_05845 [Candidatus Woesebacteria bacterium]|nr:hypothetical protein [Candidatus Woesebacteria bacterium]
MTHWIRPLNEIVGLPAATAPAEIAGASEERFQVLFWHASRGDPAAQRELVHLRLAYLNWAYAGQRVGQSSAHPSLS